MAYGNWNLIRDYSDSIFLKSFKDMLFFLWSWKKIFFFIFTFVLKFNARFLILFSYCSNSCVSILLFKEPRDVPPATPAIGDLDSKVEIAVLSTLNSCKSHAEKLYQNTRKRSSSDLYVQIQATTDPKHMVTLPKVIPEKFGPNRGSAYILTLLLGSLPSAISVEKASLYKSKIVVFDEVSDLKYTKGCFHTCYNYGQFHAGFDENVLHPEYKY